LIAAHGLGQLFARFHQPPVAGEILGGLVLGPTLFGLLLPDVQKTDFEQARSRRQDWPSPTSSGCSS
jgi:Kef-type K+ transport system membrane component KefB